MTQVKRKKLDSGAKRYEYVSLAGLEVDHLPYSIRILLENVLRNQDDFAVTGSDVEAVLGWSETQGKATVPFTPGRVLMQDFTGVPAVVDLASIRSEIQRRQGDASRINPTVPVDMVIDHSVQVDKFGTALAYKQNVALEYERNAERYQLLKWAQQAFDNFSVVPPGMGICHQVNVEYLAQVVLEKDGVIFPDTLVGTDSHTPMVNGLGVLGWGVGGIEAEAAMLGQPLYMTLPKVVGLELVGRLNEGVTATDLVLTITRLLRDHGVVGQFVELTGPGLKDLPVTDRCTISNMSPEFGCTNTHWPIDEQTLFYLEKTNRSNEQIELVRAYAQTNRLWYEEAHDIRYSTRLKLDLSTVESTLSGPKRPQDKVLLREAKAAVGQVLAETYGRGDGQGKSVRLERNELNYDLCDGAVVMAAITSCTNTSNPSVMLGAGLLAKKAIAKGLRTKPWVKTSLAPGSKVVTSYLQRAGLLPYLEGLGFHLVGYGCTTCIGNSGDMPEEVQRAVNEHDLVVASVLSGNRNFEARIHPNIRMNFLASPLLVVAYALLGHMTRDLRQEPLGKDPNGRDVFLKDLWPSSKEIEATMSEVLSRRDYEDMYATAFSGDELWQQLASPKGQSYDWKPTSTYIKEAPFFQHLTTKDQQGASSNGKIENARVLLHLGDMVTTDHISPAGKFQTTHPAGLYLQEKGVEAKDFNSYGARRGNHEVMMRGTFANVRIRNKLAKQEGGYTFHFPSQKEMTVFEAATQYMKSHTPLIVLGGKEYGSGSSRDWAAKGTKLLGVRAVIAESFERIHRANLVGMGVLPIEFAQGESASSLGLKGDELYDIQGIETLEPQKKVRITARTSGGRDVHFQATLRLDSAIEIAYYQHGGILPYVVLNKFLSNNKKG